MVCFFVDGECLFGEPTASCLMGTTPLPRDCLNQKGEETLDRVIELAQATDMLTLTRVACVFFGPP